VRQFVLRTDVKSLKFVISKPVLRVVLLSTHVVWSRIRSACLLNSHIAPRSIKSIVKTKIRTDSDDSINVVLILSYLLKPFAVTRWNQVTDWLLNWKTSAERLIWLRWGLILRDRSLGKACCWGIINVATWKRLVKWLKTWLWTHKLCFLNFPLTFKHVLIRVRIAVFAIQTLSKLISVICRLKTLFQIALVLL
jgi:hypothetical protein